MTDTGLRTVQVGSDWPGLHHSLCIIKCMGGFRLLLQSQSATWDDAQKKTKSLPVLPTRSLKALGTFSLVKKTNVYIIIVLNKSMLLLQNV